MAYPKWKYHADHAPALVHTEEQEQAMGADWAESPAEARKVDAAPAQAMNGLPPYGAGHITIPAADAPKAEAPKRKRGKQA